MNQISKVALLLAITIKCGFSQSHTSMSSAKECRTQCIGKGYEFCGKQDHTGGFCCYGKDGCPQEFARMAPFCSSKMSEGLEDFACPVDDKCGPSKLLEAKSENYRLNVGSTELQKGDTCTYMITSEDAKRGELIQISELYLNNVDLTFFYGASELKNSTEKIKVKSSSQQAKSYDFDSTHPVFIVAEFKSEEEETGFSISYLRTTIIDEIDVLKSRQSAETQDEESIGEKADSLIEQTNTIDEFLALPIETLIFISVFILMLLIALLATCIGQCKNRSENNSNKIISEYLERDLEATCDKGSALDRAKQIIIEIEAGTEPFDADGYSPDQEDLKNKDKDTQRGVKLTTSCQETQSTARHLTESSESKRGPTAIRKSFIQQQFDDVIQKDCESGISDLNANHFFSQTELASMPTLTHTNIHKASTQKHDNVIEGNFSDHLRQIPRYPSQQNIDINPARNIVLPGRGSKGQESSASSIMSSMYATNNHNSRAPRDHSRESVAIRNQLTVNEQQLLRDPNSHLSKKLQPQGRTILQDNDDEEEQIWARYHQFLHEKYRQQSMKPVQIHPNSNSVLSHSKRGRSLDRNPNYYKC